MTSDIKSKQPTGLIPLEPIAARILVIRGQKVLLDEDLAVLYGVETRRLNEQVRRNAERFPADFMFQLDDAEYAALISQIATSKPGRGGRRKLPLAFTEHGAIMAATVLNSPRAVEVSVYVVRLCTPARSAGLNAGTGRQARCPGTEDGTPVVAAGVLRR